MIEKAVRMNCEQVPSWATEYPPPPLSGRGRFDNVAAALKELGEFAEPHGVIVSQEMHSDFSDPEYCVAVMERVNRPERRVGFQLRLASRELARLVASRRSALIRPIYDLTRKWWTNIHTHQMESEGPAGHWPYYRELFRLLVADGYQGLVSNECSYKGPDPERVLRLYTMFFEMCTDPATYAPLQ